MEAKLIRYQTLDPLASVIAVDDNTLYTQKSLHLKFDAAQITRIEIKLSKQCNLIVRLYNQNMVEKDAYKVIMKFYTYDPPCQIYNSIIENHKTFTQLKINLEDAVGIYNLQLYGFPQPKQMKLDQFLIKPQFQDNVGSYGNFTSSITMNKDPAGRDKKINLKKLQEEQDLNDALEQSYLDAQIQQINQEKHLFTRNPKKVKFENDDDEMSLEVIMLNEKPEPPKNYRQKEPLNLGYTDQQKPKQHHNDEIKLNWMIKYKSDEIDYNFMQEHAILEQSMKRNRGLKQIMYN